jgi:hypothetical protein
VFVGHSLTLPVPGVELRTQWPKSISPCARLSGSRGSGQKSAFGSYACLGHWDNVGAIRAGASTGRAGHRQEVCGG